MSTNLTEEEMRRALFGPLSKAAASQESSPVPSVGKAKPRHQRSTGNKALTSKLRVILHVTKEFEGKVEVFTHDADTLSTLVAEQEATAAARKKRYRYVEVVSVKQIP